ncbi:DUF523 domain-containing protein [Planotetraspora sp. A-T 1434]|uniref:DUF523 domain-containing protein n=1 Tax=Planotetraspora sp. A-T 1434 TaxID=2979219 RepID=UPI0021C089F9|nr:DUF523 domain-containing protein [Planotetraspora sp. A-T 1434]MCT9930915.1 DUF523 domain-containing protein [Planotetraspora sp. A-T 1434]
MERILVSACLLGSRVRYDGGAKTSDDELLAAWRAEGRLVPFCPEVEGGLPVPRPPAEIEGGVGGAAVLTGAARILTPDGEDVTNAFLSGAQRALAVAQSFGVRLAILKEGSPSCGSLRIYDGTFRGRLTPGRGVTAALLELNGIRVFGEDRIPDAADHLAGLLSSRQGDSGSGTASSGS